VIAAAESSRRRRTEDRPTISTKLDVYRVEQLAVRCGDAGSICGVSPRLWRSLDSAAKVPRGIRLGGSRAKVWVVAELNAWLAAGAPPRDQWERMRNREAGK
jgi:hypothetical protein